MWKPDGTRSKNYFQTREQLGLLYGFCATFVTFLEFHGKVSADGGLELSMTGLVCDRNRVRDCHAWAANLGYVRAIVELWHTRLFVVHLHSQPSNSSADMHLDDKPSHINGKKCLVLDTTCSLSLADNVRTGTSIEYPDSNCSGLA